MLSLDQVLELETKVNAAVNRIVLLNKEVAQLKSENDALSRKCSELTKALSEKTDLANTLENNQTKIEDGILKALNRLDAIENSIISDDGSAAESYPPASPVQNETPVLNENPEKIEPNVIEETVPEESTESPVIENSSEENDINVPVADNNTDNQPSNETVEPNLFDIF